MLSQNTKRYLFPLLFALIFPFFLTWCYFILGRDNSVLARIGFISGKSIQFLFPLIWSVLVFRVPVRLRPFNRRGFLEGGIFGLLVLILILSGFLFARASGLSLPFDQLKTELGARLQSFGLLNPAAYLLVLVFYSTCHSGLEEYYWRWFVFRNLEKILSPAGAVLVSSFGFTLHHILLLGNYFGFRHILTWICVLGVFVGGVYWSTLYRRTDSIWGCWISHGLIDAAIFAVGYLVLF